MLETESYEQATHLQQSTMNSTALCQKITPQKLVWKDSPFVNNDLENTLVEMTTNDMTTNVNPKPEQIWYKWTPQQVEAMLDCMQSIQPIDQTDYKQVEKDFKQIFFGQGCPFIAIIWKFNNMVKLD